MEEAVPSLSPNVYGWLMPADAQPSVLPDAYARLFTSHTGQKAVSAVGNESKTLDALSALSIEVLLEYLLEEVRIPSHFQQRFLAVPGKPTEPPALLILDPEVATVSETRRLTQAILFDPKGLSAALERLRPVIAEVAGEKAGSAFSQLSSEAATELMWISQPEVIVTSRPKMVHLSAPSPHLEISSGSELSSAGVFCKDSDGVFGVTACFHGTGNVGTAVTVGGVASVVALAHETQDIVFIPLASPYPMPAVYGLQGVRDRPAPSEAEPVSFDGAGTGHKVNTFVKSHDAGILRSGRTLQLKVQTPGDTNSGDSGAALVDQNDKVVAFGFQRTGFGEFPELTDWIWAANALSTLGLTPL